MSAGLGKAGVQAMKWSAISTFARFGLQLIAQIVLARALGPGNYGIFGIGMVVLQLSNFLSNFGFAWSLLHRPEISEEDIRFTFTWQVLIGLVTMAVVWLAAPWLAEYFREPRVLPVIRWLSLACLLGAASATSNNLLQRALNFRVAGLIQVISYALGYICVGIPMAKLGFGVQSLVAAWLVQSASALVGSFIAHPHSVRPLFRYQGMAAAFSTGGTVFLTNIVNWWLNNLDRVMLGRLLDVHAVGLYSAGYNLATMPNSLLLSTLQPSFMTAASRMRSEPERLCNAYLQMLATVWALTLPFFVILAVLSPDVIHLLYGPQWSDTGTVLAILFLGMPAYVTWGLSTPVLWNTKRKNYEFALQIPVLALGALGFYAFTRWGVNAAAVIASLLLMFRMGVIATAAFKAVGLKFSRLLPYIGRGILLSVLGGFAAWAGSLLGNRLGSPFVAVAAGTLLSGVTMLLILLRRPDLIGPLALSMLYRFFPRLEKKLDLVSSS